MHGRSPLLSQARRGGSVRGVFGGEHHRAHKLYQLSLLEPLTDNVVAQIQYLSSKRSLSKYGMNGLDLPSARCEAHLARQTDENWDDALKQAMEWQADRHRFLEGQLWRSPISRDYHGQTIGSRLKRSGGSVANAEDQLLRNNLAVAYARLGCHADAKAEFNKIRPPLQRGSPSLSSMRRKGLMAYIAGNLDLGRGLSVGTSRRFRTGAPTRRNELCRDRMGLRATGSARDARGTEKDIGQNCHTRRALGGAQCDWCTILSASDQTELRATKLVSAQEYARSLWAGDARSAEPGAGTTGALPAPRRNRR